MKIKVSNLRGKALDWAAATAAGRPVSIIGGVIVRGANVSCGQPYRPSERWGDGGPFIESCKVTMEWNVDHWEATTEDAANGWIEGDTALEAAMRAVVMHDGKLVVEIPDELAGGGK